MTFLHSWRCILAKPVLLLGLGLGPAVVAQAALPCVAIDVGTIVECAEVSPADVSVAAHRDRVIEARFRLSLLVDSGREQDLEQLQITIDSPERRLRVIDFQPRTELASELAGDVEVCKSQDTVQSLNASLGGVVNADHGPAHVQASPAAGVGLTQNRGSKETFHRLAPRQLVLASGTTHAEHGVFFKWRHSSQVTLEGSREVTVRFLVPHDWRGDWVQLQAEVLGHQKGYFSEKVESCGQAHFYVGLYIAGDSQAQQAALALALAQAPPEIRQQAADAAGVERRVAYKPAMSTEPRKSTEWFGLPSLFKFCSHEREVIVDDSAERLTRALDNLGSLSTGQSVQRKARRTP